MNRPNDSFSLRTVAEKVFAGIAAAAIIGFISAGTVAMCFPNVA
jgi:hypothetical protein